MARARLLALFATLCIRRAASDTDVVAGASNPKQLTSVWELLKTAHSTSHQFEEQVSEIQAEVQQEQENTTASVMSQKEEYEDALRHQREQNRAIQADIDLVDKETRDLKAQNDKLETGLRKLQVDNLQLRASLRTLQEHVDTARHFIFDSFQATNDTDAPELRILARPNLPPTVDTLLEAAKGSGVKQSLVQLPLTDVSGIPVSSVHELARAVAAMTAATKDASAKLKKDFEAAWDTGMETQRALNGTRAASLSKKQDQVVRQELLGQAESRLNRTHADLTQRLDALRTFAQSMGAAGSNRSADRPAAVAESLAALLPGATARALAEVLPPARAGESEATTASSNSGNSTNGSNSTQSQGTAPPSEADSLVMASSPPSQLQRAQIMSNSAPPEGQLARSLSDEPLRVPADLHAVPSYPVPVASGVPPAPVPARSLRQPMSAQATGWLSRLR